MAPVFIAARALLFLGGNAAQGQTHKRAFAWFSYLNQKAQEQGRPFFTGAFYVPEGFTQEAVHAHFLSILRAKGTHKSSSAGLSLTWEDASNKTQWNYTHATQAGWGSTTYSQASGQWNKPSYAQTFSNVDAGGFGEQASLPDLEDDDLEAFAPADTLKASFEDRPDVNVYFNATQPQEPFFV